MFCVYCLYDFHFSLVVSCIHGSHSLAVMSYLSFCVRVYVCIWPFSPSPTFELTQWISSCHHARTLLSHVNTTVCMRSAMGVWKRAYRRRLALHEREERLQSAVAEDHARKSLLRTVIRAWRFQALPAMQVEKQRELVRNRLQKRMESALLQSSE